MNLPKWIENEWDPRIRDALTIAVEKFSQLADLPDDGIQYKCDGGCAVIAKEALRRIDELGR